MKDRPLNPTINDIARVAEVSLATVDRVLNARPGVRERTVRKVNKAIAELGYVRDAAAANLARGRVHRFLFILPSNDNEFISLLKTEIGRLGDALRHERTRLDLMRVAAFDPAALAAVLDDVSPDSVDGVAIFGPETPSVQASVAQLKARGLAVVSLVADIPGSERDHYVGIDNVAAGRTAAQLLGRFLRGRQGKVLVLTGSLLARDHVERRRGFDAVMASAFPQLEVIASLEGRDDPERIERMLPGIFAQHRDVVGIYASAAGNEGLLRYFRSARPDPRPVVIAHELTDLSRRALADGSFDAVISQDAGHLVRSAVRLMRATRDRLPINAAQERIRIDIYLKENMPSDETAQREEKT